MNYASIREAAKESHDKRQRHHPAKRRDGGAVHTDEKQDRALIKSMLAKEEKKEKRADGGAVQGRARGGRADRPHKGAGKTTVNIVMPPAGGSGAMAMPPRPMMPPGAAAMPPGAGMPPRRPSPPAYFPLRSRSLPNRSRQACAGSTGRGAGSASAWVSPARSPR